MLPCHPLNNSLTMFLRKGRTAPWPVLVSGSVGSPPVLAGSMEQITEYANSILFPHKQSFVVLPDKYGPYYNAHDNPAPPPPTKADRYNKTGKAFYVIHSFIFTCLSAFLVNLPASCFLTIPAVILNTTAYIYTTNYLYPHPRRSYLLLGCWSLLALVLVGFEVQHWMTKRVRNWLEGIKEIVKKGGEVPEKKVERLKGWWGWAWVVWSRT